VVRAILAGDETTGVSLMQMDPGLDTGPVIATREVPIGAIDTAGSLTKALAQAGGALLEEDLPRYLEGAVVPVAQDDALATAAAKVTTSEAHIDPQRHSTRAIDRAVRAFNPRPGAWCTLGGERFKVWRVERATSPGAGTPGRVEERDDRIVMTTVDGAVALIEVQPTGKPRMAATDWMNGRRGLPAELQG
jgi:methionyl-tRNA formyltransferase